MKALNWIGWASAGIGVVLIILGVISGIIGRRVLPIQHAVNYFHMANSFFLAAVVSFLTFKKCEDKK